MSKEDGWRAFPVSSEAIRNMAAALECAPPSQQEALAEQIAELAGGMSLRDYFAAKALPAYFSDGTGHANDEQAAKWAYRIADAMLKARG
jgi:hypothetical protein